MEGLKKLELNLETIRELSEDDLATVAGGQETKLCKIITNTQSPACPSGATWFTSCETYSGSTCS
jgi:hypothetical protein